MAPPSALDTPGATDTQAATLSGPLSINGVYSRRAKAPKMPGGVAPHASSDMFKSPGHGKPKAKRWDHRLSEESAARKGSSLKGAAKYLPLPGMISLGGGLPSSDYFPFSEISATVPTAPSFSSPYSDVVTRVGKHDVSQGKGTYDIHIAFNYGQATGSPQLLRFVTEHTELVHSPPYQDWQCTLTSGSTSALDMAFRMLTMRGDFILTEEYTFASAVETAIPMGVGCIGIKIDAEGLLPSSMDDILSNWDESARGCPKPWLLYTVPSGQNPTGATQGEQRRREIYKCAQKHDVYILEDEPYFFLQMQPYTGPSVPDVPPPVSHEEFLKALVPSLLSMDVDGRVMRMDSFSKVIAPGTRTGWITASDQIIERFVRHQEVSTQNPSGISQLMLYKLLDETWGHGGYLDWLIKIRLDYTRRRDIICTACERYLPSEVTGWDPPMAGMFHWINVLWRRHPKAITESMADVEEEIFQAAISRGVLVSKGSWFRAERDQGEGEDMFFRTTFAAASELQLTEGIKRLGEGIRSVFGLEPAKEANGMNGTNLV